MENARDKKMSSAQMQKMLELVEARPELAGTRSSGLRLWNEAAVDLNREEGSVKTGDKWQKAWADWRSKTRSKVRQLSVHGQGDAAPLSELELRLVSMLDTFGWTSVSDEANDRKIPVALESEREPKMSASQMETLVELLRTRPELLARRGADGWAGGGGGWTELAVTLNADTNGPSKTADKWQKAWVDWKCKTRSKVSRLREKAVETGKKQPLKRHLTSLEYNLANLMGWHHTGTDDLSEDEEKFAIQSPAAAASSSEEEAGAGGGGGGGATPAPTSHITNSVRWKKRSVFVRKGRRAEGRSPERGPRAAQFLELERQKVAALRGVAAELAGLRADLRSYFRYCVDDVPGQHSDT